MQKIVMWAPEENDKIVITKDSKNHTYKAGEIFTVNRSTLDSFSITVKERVGLVIPYEDYQLIPPVKEGIELDVTKLKVTYYDAKIGHAAALDAELRLYYSRDNLKTWQRVHLEQNDEQRHVRDVTITISARLKKNMTEAQVAGLLDAMFAKDETFKSWGTLVKGKNWEQEPMLRPNHVQKHLEEKIATRLLCAIEQMTKAPKVTNTVQFVAVKDGQEYTIPADDVHGLYEALHAYYVELKNWCWLEEAEKELGEAYKVRENIARALELPEVATYEEIAERTAQLTKMGEQMDNLKKEYQRIRAEHPDGPSPTLSGQVTDRSPFKRDLRTRSNNLGVMNNPSLMKAVELVTNMVTVPIQKPVEAVEIKEEVETEAVEAEVVSKVPVTDVVAQTPVEETAVEETAVEETALVAATSEPAVSIMSVSKAPKDETKLRKATPKPKGRAKK